MKPQTWVEEERSEIVEQIVEAMVSTMTLEELRTHVWDWFYDEILRQDWEDIWMYAETYTPEMLERFQYREDGEPSA